MVGVEEEYTSGVYHGVSIPWKTRCRQLRALGPSNLEQAWWPSEANLLMLAELMQQAER